MPLYLSEIHCEIMEAKPVMLRTLRQARRIFQEQFKMELLDN